MTNGQPLSVRAAIKPISTLTKPLRSVDTETKQPAQALRERTDSTVVPAAAVVGEAMVALTLARCLPREVRRRPHRRRARRARRLQAAHRLPGLSRVSEAGDRLHRLHGRRQEHRARRCPRGGAGDDRDRRADGARARQADPRGLRARTARRRFRAREAEVVGALLENADGGAIALGGGSILSERVRAALDRHIVVWLQIDAAEAWRRIEGTERPLATSAEDVASAAGGTGAALRGAGRRGGPDGGQGCRRAGAAGDPVARRAARGDEAALGDERLRASTRSSSAAGCSTAGWWPLEGRRFCVTDSDVAPCSTTSGCRGSELELEVRPGEALEDAWQRPSGSCASWLEAGMTREDHVVAARRRRRRRSRGLLRARLPARRAGGPGADDAGRPGRLRLRRQDRRRPAGGQELRRCLPPAGRGDRRHRDPRRRCRPGSWPSGFVEVAEDRPARRWLASGSGCAASRPSTRTASTTSSSPAPATSARSSPPTSATRGLRARPQPRPHGRPRDRGGQRLPRYRHGEAIGLGLLAALRLSDAAGAARRGRARSSTATALPTATRSRRSTMDAILDTLQRDKKRTAAGVGFVLLSEPGEPRTGAARRPG